MRSRTSLPVTTIAALLVILAGCGEGEADNVAVSGADQTTTTTTTVADDGDDGDGDDGDGATTTTTGGEDAASGSGAGGATDGDDGTEIIDDQIVLSDVNIGREGDVERVVFEFQGPQAPSHEVRWVERPIYTAGEGAEVEIDGEAILEIAMVPASPARIDGEEVEQVYTGGDIVQGAGGVINEAVMFGAFESRLEWAIGLQREVPYRVSALTNPTRVVVQFDTSG
jgi:hypothetical protein